MALEFRLVAAGNGMAHLKVRDLNNNPDRWWYAGRLRLEDAEENAVSFKSSVTCACLKDSKIHTD